jgi:hypothetical protein
MKINSGENHETYFQWDFMSENVNHLNCLVQNLLRETFSNTFIKTLNVEFNRLIGRDNDLLVSNDMLKAEVERTIWRSYITPKNENKSKEILKKEKETKCEILSNVVIYHHSKGDFYNFLNALNICDFIHRLLATGSDMPELTMTEREVCKTL